MRLPAASWTFGHNGVSRQKAAFAARVLAAVVLTLLSGCQAPAAAWTPTIPPATVTASATRVPPSPTVTPSVTPTAGPTEPPPIEWTTRGLLPDVRAVPYVADACRYLEQRWDPERSRPGTVVAPVMFHSIRTPNNMVYDSVTISTDYLAAIVDRARAHGFETITAEELVGFLEENRPIPYRSMIWFVDDRRPGTVEEYLLPYAESFDWTVSLGWIIADTRADLWAWMERMNETGRLDVQSHGYWHVYMTEYTDEETMREEIFDPIPVLEEHFGYRPIAYVWPGGNFTPKTVQLAREAGFRIGFTAYSRGPVMFNWVPLGEPEILVEDPVMVLPRYWSTAAAANLDQVDQMADEAAEFARQNYPAEANWYRQTCGGELPPLPE